MIKEDITLAALRLFLLHGYRNVSLVDVAHEVGITKGGVYHYFASKEDLLHTAIRFLVDRSEGRCLELFCSKESIKETLSAIIVDRELEFYVQRLLNIEPGDYRANQASLAHEVMLNFPDLQEWIDRVNLRFYQLLAEKLQSALEQGQIRRDLDIPTLALLILTILKGQNFLGTQLNSPERRQDMMQTIWQLIQARSD